VRGIRVLDINIVLERNPTPENYLSDLIRHLQILYLRTEKEREIVCVCV